MNIAFLGLGRMGTGIAHRLLEAGHPLRVWNRTPEKMVALQTAGALPCASPAAAVAAAEIVITSLMDDTSLRAVCDGPEGIIANMASSAIHLGLSTISPVCADWLAKHHAASGSRYVSGPVVGRPDAAAAGTLAQFLAGDASAIAVLQPICQAFAATLIPIPGPARGANSQKLCVNFFIAALIEVMAECYTFAEATGASPALMAEFLQATLAHPGLRGYATRMHDRAANPAPGFSLRAGLKDVRLMLDAAREAACPLDVAAIVEDKMLQCLAHGLDQADWSVIQEATRARAGLPAGVNMPRN